MNNCIINDVFTEFLNILQKCKNTIISDNDYDHCLNIINKLIIEKDLILISKIQQITINKKIIELDENIQDVYNNISQKHINSCFKLHKVPHKSKTRSYMYTIDVLVNHKYNIQNLTS